MGGEAQTLLEPVAVTLAKEEYAAVLEHAEQLYQVGFEVEDFRAGTVLVRSAPLCWTAPMLPQQSWRLPDIWHLLKQI